MAAALFGIPYRVGDEVKHRPVHSYTMKQAIQEGFILDVLKNYTPVDSYYRLAKTVGGDPEFDVKKARKKLRLYVESHSKAIRDKAEIMADHFLEQVMGQNKIGGQARAMVVTGSIQRAIQYFCAIRDYLNELKSPYKAIVAFSGEPEFKGEKVSEAKLNGFPPLADGRDLSDDLRRMISYSPRKRGLQLDKCNNQRPSLSSGIPVDLVASYLIAVNQASNCAAGLRLGNKRSWNHWIV
jgi:type I site-specific restriction-modification system R (restriction) subunit